MDKNSIIGFSLLVVLLVVYFTYSNYEQTKYQEYLKTDSIANAKLHPKPLKSVDTATHITANDAINDSIQNAMPIAFKGTAQDVVLNNELVDIKISTKGAGPSSVVLNKFKTYTKKPLNLFDTSNHFGFLFPYNAEQISTADLYFTPNLQTHANGDQLLEMTADLGDNKKVIMSYLLPNNSYMLKYSIRFVGVALSNNISLKWNFVGLNTEKDVYNERLATQVYYQFKDKDFDYFTITGEKNETVDKPITWLGYRQQYFSTVLVSKDAFNKVNIKATTALEPKDIVSKNNFVFDMSSKAGTDQNFDFEWYFGPNDYSTLKAFGIGMEEMVPYGFGIFSFVKYINKWLLLPLFTFLSNNIGSLAMVIVLMTIVIRLALSFFTYKSFLSTAKMRVLRPELDELKEKYGDDRQKLSMEQMNLYRNAGVNPLGGCLPMLFQLPILLSLYYFIPTVISLRQSSFLWADDLSTYDSIASWTTHIPLLSSVYGNHVSLFTLLMTISSLLLALYSRNNTPQDMNNPMMKWMPFVFPIFLMGFFNKMAAALTFYYTLSNLLSLLQQLIIQKFFIDEKKLHAQIQANKSRPAANSKWSEKLAEIQKQQAAARNKK